VRIEPRHLQQNLVVASLNDGEFEQLLLRHGIVEQVLNDGMYSVRFARRNTTSEDVVYTINGAGLRVVWHVGQNVRANTRFYSVQCIQILADAGVRVADLYPSGTFDLTGVIHRDAGAGRYIVIMALPSNNVDDEVEEFMWEINSNHMNAVWYVGDNVHVISYASAACRRIIQAQFPNTDIEEIRSFVFRIDSTADNMNHRYNISGVVPGRANRLFLLVEGSKLRSSGPARVLDMDHTGAMSSSDSDDFD